MSYDEEDNFLVDMISEANVEIRDTLYERYLPTIKSVVKKYTKSARKTGLEINDLMQEANLAFTDAINTYNQEGDASLRTFITLCIDRRLINVIKKAMTTKNMIDQNSLSLDYTPDEDSSPLKDVIKDELADPSSKLSERDKTESLIRRLSKQLSSFEFEVFSCMANGLNYLEIAEILDKSPKQIDNTMQRVRSKVRGLLKGDER